MEQKIITPGENYKGFDDWIKENGCKKVLLVCDGSIWYQKKFNVHLEEIDKLGVEMIGFRDFQPNPLYENVQAGVELFRTENCDSIIAVGGGSAMDVAKCIKLYSSLPGGLTPHSQSSSTHEFRTVWEKKGIFHSIFFACLPDFSLL